MNDGKYLSKTDYAELSFEKSVIDDLSKKYDLNPHLLFLSATCITLTKFTSTTRISILTKNSNFGIVPLIFDDKNRKRTVLEYCENIEKILSDSQSLNDLDKLNGDFNFSFIFNDDYEDSENASLLILKSPNQYVLKLVFDREKYRYSYALSFLRSIKRVFNHFIDLGISKLKIEDIALREEKPIPDFKLKRNPLVNELLESQANKTPDKIALRTCGKDYTFRQVNDEANRIANALIKRGIEKGSTVSFMLKRNKTLITTFLGIIKAGCVAIPLDMNYPLDKINYIRQNSDSKYIITTQSVEGAISPQDLIGEGDSSFPDVNLNPDDPIFLLYTSGSTGNPKGVVLTHCGISNLISVHIKNNYNRLLSISSIAFDISEEDILVSLTNEKELIFANDDEISDIVLLSRLIEKTKPEFVNLTPSRLLSYVQVPEFEKALKKFSAIGCGGEQFTKNVYQSIKRYADIDIYNGYGPLETSLTSNSKKIENPDFITNGKPLLNYITDVRDIDGKLLPYGVIGELYIGGIGVSKGYYKMEDKTKEVFITINGIPYYKSGDYAIQLPSDEIIIRGRVDHQIKLRGQRVDPQEIEQVIIRYSGIDNAVVSVHEINGENHLCGYFTSKININTDDLRKFLSDILSEYMLPTFLMQLDSFPETPNGKIDRKMLPKPKLNTENEQPINNFEKTLYNFCINILNYHDFGVTDNLFKLGFTSLMLMRLNSDISHEFGISLKHSKLMNSPSIRKISHLLENNVSMENIEPIKSNSSNKYPMSSQQKRLYVIYRKNPTLTNYNLVNVRKFKKAVDIDMLEKAVNNVIEVEEILRTSFHVENGEYIQKIHEIRPIKVDVIEVNEDVGKIVRQNICPFNLEKEPLIRIKAIKSKGETYIFRDMHHIIGDQISNDLLYEKIKDAYLNKEISKNKIQYKDYTSWVLKEQLKEADYWKNKRVSASGTEIFPDFKRPLNQTFNGNKISYNLDKKFIEKLSKANNTTVYKLLLSQFVILLYKYTDEKSIQIGTVTSGRTHPNLDETLGMFVNTLPFIQEISSQDTFKETLIKTEEEVSGLFANQNYSMERIIEDHRMSTNNSLNPLFNIVFIQNTADEFNSDFNWDESKFDLTCSLKSSPDELILEFDYNQDLYTFEKINGLLNHYIYLIDCIEENADKKLNDIKILPSCEENELKELSGIDLDRKPDSIMDLLKSQIRKNPSKIILSDDKTSLSYDDFNLKTNSLANYLKDNLNVKRQDKIVLVADRSIESVLAFYSILKLDAVYVPVSPFAPEKRIAHIAGEVNAKLILTNINLDIDGVDIVNLDKKSLYEFDGSELNIENSDMLSIIHTSGTTGVPKGVKISHENVENCLISIQNQFYDENCKIFYHTTNIAFDTSLFEIIFSLTNAIHLHIIKEDYDFSKVPADIINQKSMINTVPAKLKMFLTLPNFDKVMENVVHLILAGEALGKNLVNEIRKNYNSIIYNAYGPCEATIFASIKEIASSNKITIGKANINTHIYILNDEKQLCPIGIPGELCIGGKQVSEGYFNKINETNKQFIENPFGEGKLFCSGDLAFIDLEGEINFIGRKDSQIKINGQRIEVDEINRQIEKNKDIIQSVTVPSSDRTQLYSYILAERSVDIEELFRNLEKVLLPYMVPASIIQIDSIPLNNNGKVDVDKLPEPKIIRHEYKPPSNVFEKSIIKIWEKVLEVKPIGINDNFYHIGGDSIKAIRIVSLLQNEGISCSPGDILNYKTPYLIAQNIDSGVEISYDAFEGPIDLLPIQKFFFDQIHTNNYTQDFILQLKTDLDIDILQNALNELTDFHDMLRASFRIENGQTVQEILPLNTKICTINEFEIYDDFKGNLSEIIEKSVRSIDVYNKLIDASLIRFEGKNYLVFVVHHLIVDGVSWNILISDLSYIYQNLKESKEFELTRPYPYKNWIEDVKHLADNVSEVEKQHWIEVNNQLDDSKIKGKAKGFDFKVKIDYDGDNLLMMSEEEYWALAISRAYKRTYGRDIIFNRESHGRDDNIANIHRTVGWFTSQYPVPVNISNKYDDISLIRDIYEIKTAFGNVDNLGLNYASLIYTINELNYRHCPVTFNFLSTEFTFEDKLFKSVNHNYSKKDNTSTEVYGADFNIEREDDFYRISGDYAQGTFISDKFDLFVENITGELEFIANFSFKNIACALSEPQLEVYFNEKNYNMGTAYSTWEIVECPQYKSVGEIKQIIHTLINRHPILKGRILDGDMPLLICDKYPLIEEVCCKNHFTLLKPFDLEKCLSRFFIVNKKYIFYDIHHIINDAMGFSIIKDDLNAAFEGNVDDEVDLGFIYNSRDSFESKFKPTYKSAHEFYKKLFTDMDNANSGRDYSDGKVTRVSLPIRGVRSTVEEFAFKNDITVGTFLNAIFAYSYSKLMDSKKVFYNFVEHGRHEEYAKNALGMFARTTPIRVDCNFKNDEEYLKYFADLALNSMSNNLYPFRLLEEEFDLNNDVLFEYNFDLNDVSDIADGISVREDVTDAFAQFFCIVNDFEDGYVINVKHTGMFSQDEAIRFVKLYSEKLLQFLNE